MLETGELSSFLVVEIVFRMCFKKSVWCLKRDPFLGFSGERTEGEFCVFDLNL